MVSDATTMNLACTSLLMRARWAAQLALSTLVLTTGCTEDSGETDTEATTNPDTTDATAATDATDATAATNVTEPTTGEAETGTTAAAEEVSYAMDIQPVWDTKCVAGCHTPGGIAATGGPILGADV